jgi:hypothetical protein
VKYFNLHNPGGFKESILRTAVFLFLTTLMIFIPEISAQPANTPDAAEQRVRALVEVLYYNKLAEWLNFINEY